MNVTYVSFALFYYFLLYYYIIYLILIQQFNNERTVNELFIHCCLVTLMLTCLLKHRCCVLIAIKFLVRHNKSSDGQARCFGALL